MEDILLFFGSLPRKDLATLIVAVYAAVIGTLNLALPRLIEWKDNRKAVFRALQGEKEAIAEVAMQVVNDKWAKKISGRYKVFRHRRKAFRQKLIKALSMAFVLESSDRAKSYVLAAFKHIAKNPKHKDELVDQLAGILKIYEDYYAVIRDNEFEKRRIQPLKLVIGKLKGDKETK